MRQFVNRLVQLVLGLFLFSLGIVITMRANVGFAPWDVFHAGIAATSGISIGLVSILVGVVIMVATILLGEKIGLGTIANMVLIGLFMDLLLQPGLLPRLDRWYFSYPFLVLGLFIISIGSYFYIKSGFGAGPRDSLMLALTRRTGLPIGLCRGGIEIAAVASGWALGGQVGPGTVLAALGIGFCVQITFRVLGFDATAVRHESLGQTWIRLRPASSGEAGE